MVKRVIKFPLKMKNGAEVRNLEELRENADIESLMQYYFSGQLSRWCKAFNISGIPENMEKLNYSFVRSIAEMFDINIPDEDIYKYLSESFGDSREIKVTEDIHEEKVIDNQDIKEAVKPLADGINLDDYSIEVSPKYSDEGKISKYRIMISALKTEQYIRFVLPYEISEEYTEDMFREDLNDKIVHSIRMLQESSIYNSKRNNRFSKLNKGDTFEFGSFEGSALSWKVIRKDKDTLYAIADKIICDRKFDSNRNNWESSELRNWLNNDFYNSAFNETEKKSIVMINSDNITLLSKDEAENLMSQNERISGSWWWLRSAYPGNSGIAWGVRTDGTLDIDYVFLDGGVRPALNLKF